MEVQIDIREPKELIETIREVLEGHKITVKSLVVGDIYIPDLNILIERKTSRDFINSIFKAHLQKQLMIMNENDKESFLVIIGPQYYDEKIWIGSIVHVLLNYEKIKLVQLENNYQLALFLNSLIKNAKKPKKIVTEFYMPKIKDIDIAVKMLCSIPNVGINTALKILKYFSIREIAEGKANLKIIPGIGDKKAQNIMKTLINVYNKKFENEQLTLIRYKEE